MLQKCSIWKVAEIFFKEPTKSHYLLEISRTIKLAHTSTKKHLEELERLEIIKKYNEKRGTRNFPMYKSRIDDESYRKYKKIYNLISIQESGMIEFLRDNLGPQCIILFGSYLDGYDTEYSDIDLFLERGYKEIDLKRFEKKLGRKVHIIFNKNFRKFSEELKSNIINGFVLYGYLEAYDNKR